MMPPESQPLESKPMQLLVDYAESLQGLGATTPLPPQQLLKVLRSRDQIQAALSQGVAFEDEALIKLVELDKTLQQQANLIAQAEYLAPLRQNLQPPESAWWWHLQPQVATPRAKPLSAKFDWLWNTGTVVCLVLATSFGTQTARAFSTEGFDFLGTLSTISQGAGLAFVAGGALTDRGQKMVAQTLNSLKIPSALHAEATFGASVVLLAATYGIHQNLPVVGTWYFSQGQHHEQKGEWSQAFKSYRRALNFNPDDYKTQIATGFLYEKLGNFEQAVEVYKKGSVFGFPEFLNAQGRAMLMGALRDNDWRGGIDEKTLRDVKYLLNRAQRVVNDLSTSKTPNPRLFADVTINQAIADFAGLNPDQKISPTTQQTIDDGIGRLRYLEQINAEKPQTTADLTTFSTVGETRSQCYRWRGYSMADRVSPGMIAGYDFSVLRINAFFSCYLFGFSGSAATQNDGSFLNSYKFPGESTQPQASLASGNISEFMRIVHFYTGENAGYPAHADQVTLIQTSAEWLTLSNQLKTLIEKNLNLNEAGMSTKLTSPVVWRILLNRDGQILGYFAYDPLSREFIQSQPWLQPAQQTKLLQQLGKQLEAGQTLEFADFKVVLSPEGKILQLLPWAMAYPTLTRRCEVKCRNLLLNSQVEAVFQPYSPDLNQLGEQAALLAMTQARLRFLMSSLQLGKDWDYSSPSTFKLKVAADGRILAYQAADALTAQRYGNSAPFEGMLQPNASPQQQQMPVTDLKLEIRAFAFQLTPWNSPK